MPCGRVSDSESRECGRLVVECQTLNQGSVFALWKSVRLLTKGVCSPCGRVSDSESRECGCLVEECQTLNQGSVVALWKSVRL